ncbi:flagellin [Pseudoroseicyclus sp. CXY001]|uniref:flagellin n=1 Tax=Pseudoroseicyclus sp. CXY001 TaxID=3242492 RepID=UPI00357112EC
MPMTLGDGAQNFFLRTTNLALKEKMNRYAEELSSGQHKDLPKTLGIGQGRLVEVNARLSMIKTEMEGGRDLANMLSATQFALSRADDVRGLLAGNLMSISPEPGQAELTAGAGNGALTFGDMVSALGTRYGGQALFAGTDTDGVALAPADDILADLRATITAAAPADGDALVAEVLAYFDAGGGYDTAGYLGDTGALAARRVGTGPTITMEARADDPAIRRALAGAALAAVAMDGVPALTNPEAADVMHRAGETLLSAGTALAALQGQLGVGEERLEEATVRLGAERTSLSILRNDMVNADPFSTASALQEVQVQLETHYLLTARMSEMTLTRYI